MHVWTHKAYTPTDSSRTLLECRYWMLTLKLINNTAARSHMCIVCTLTPHACSWKGFDSVIALSLQANTIIRSMWTDRSARKSMDRCATFRKALVSFRRGRKQNAASICDGSGAVCCGKSRCQIKLQRVKEATRTELLFCLGSSNTRNGLKNTSRVDFCGLIWN